MKLIVLTTVPHILPLAEWHTQHAAPHQWCTLCVYSSYMYLKYWL